MRKYAFLLLIFFTYAGIAQSTDVNSYKYLIVPKKYDFQKYPNQYRINTLVKFLFEEEGFNAIYDDERPDELISNPCGALTAEVDNRSGIFSSKVAILLKDCRGNVVFSSEEGKSKIKDYEPSYQEAIREAFDSVKSLDYSYDAAAATTVAVNTQVKTPVVAVKEPVVVEKVVPETVEAEATGAVITEVSPSGVEILYAQPKDGGYQLVDMTPKVVFVIKKTSDANTFLILEKNGMLVKRGDVWVAEYYQGDKLVKETYSIRF
ncbi:hypothetical protein [Robertkochia solimangrovi]|uniref:hypothetical protein n=1 Tax=Robertkochia solimangrovi TaxID=2213046 RepID=UPI00117D68AA|nr:hypothetical protein [Robertkochia solimangrovi]TRZ44245.1 hypothetical protein DMZ48_06950 [Robertkochia solimangrovi]